MITFEFYVLHKGHNVGKYGSFEDATAGVRAEIRLGAREEDLAIHVDRVVSLLTSSLLGEGRLSMCGMDDCIGPEEHAKQAEREDKMRKNPCEKHGRWNDSKFSVCPRCWFGDTWTGADEQLLDMKTNGIQ